MVAAETTALIQRAIRGDKTAEADLIPKIYSELHKIAGAYLRRERPDHTLQPTALVNEAYLRLTDGSAKDFQSRTHFFAVAAQVMRRILVDHARRRSAEKRGGGAKVIPLDDNLKISDEQWEFLPDLDTALRRLETLHPRAAKVVELRFFSGLEEGAISEITGVSVRTVRRDWIFARAWLYGELSDQN
jgi:RNA polymerase sigma factor (TIGR02999 family)